MMTLGSLGIFAAAATSSKPDGTAGELSLGPIDLFVIAALIGSVVMFGAATALALGWAFRAGQFENFHRGARSIFGPDEPVGERTDSFPGNS